MAKINSFGNKNDYNVKKRNKNKEEKFKVSLPVDMIEMICAYSLTDNNKITRKSLSQLYKFINMIDINAYKDDYEIQSRLLITKRILHCVVVERVDILGYIKESLLSHLPTYKELIENLFSYFESNDPCEYLDENQIDGVERFVEERLTNLHLYKHLPVIEDLIKDFKLEASDLTILNKKTEKAIDEFYKDMKSAKMDHGVSEMDFNTGDLESLTNVFERTISDMNQPSNKIKTGIKWLNTLLGGGWEQGRTYLIMGIPKGFKSGTLLSTALWGVQYNDNIKAKNPNKKPAILYLTMENSCKETLTRIYQYTSTNDLKNEKPEDASKKVFEVLNGKNIDLIVKYKANKSISTGEMDLLIDEIESEGREVVMVVQDYIKRIRPLNPIGDPRIDLGEVVNDFCSIAKARNIPIITATQLNREALKIVEQNISKKAQDIAKELSSSNVGESALTIENADVSIIINREEDVASKKMYLGFKLVASRIPIVKEAKKYFIHPFEIDNDFRLAEDINLAQPLSLESLSDGLVAFNPNNARNNMNNKNNPNPTNNKYSGTSSIFNGPSVSTNGNGVNLQSNELNDEINF